MLDFNEFVKALKRIKNASGIADAVNVYIIRYGIENNEENRKLVGPIVEWLINDKPYSQFAVAFGNSLKLYTERQ